MKGRILIKIDNDDDFRCSLMTSFKEGYDFDFSITVSENITKKDFCKEEIDALLKDKLEEVQLCVDFYDDCYEEIRLLNKYFDGEIDLNNDICEVGLNGSYNSINLFLKNNDHLREKKIVLLERLDVDVDNYNSIINNIEDLTNVYVIVDDDSEAIKVSDFKKVIDKIDSMVNEVKKFEFSPFEQALYAYDIVRDRMYKKEDNDELGGVSRDLLSVLFGDKIVCVGFSNIYKQILRKLGIKITGYFMDQDGMGHQRNMVYLKDDKYDIEGIYFCDATWDSKKGDNNYHFNNYKHFMKTKKELEKDGKGIVSRTLKKIDYNFLNILIDEYDKNWYFNSMLEYRDEITSINALSSFVLDRRVLDAGSLPKNRVIEDVEFCFGLLEKPISSKKFIKALSTVRKNQYYENPDKYPYDIKSLYTTLVKSDFELGNLGVAKLLYALFGTRENFRNISTCREVMLDYIEESNLDKEIEGVKLAKTLRKVLETKK